MARASAGVAWPPAMQREGPEQGCSGYEGGTKEGLSPMPYGEAAKCTHGPRSLSPRLAFPAHRGPARLPGSRVGQMGRSAGPRWTGLGRCCAAWGVPRSLDRGASSTRQRSMRGRMPGKRQLVIEGIGNAKGGHVQGSGARRPEEPLGRAAFPGALRATRVPVAAPRNDGEYVFAEKAQGHGPTLWLGRN
jgi:hypothetical protein